MENFWFALAGAVVGTALLILFFHHYFRPAFFADMKEEIEKMWDKEDAENPPEDKVIKTVTLPAEKMQELLDRLGNAQVSLTVIKEAFEAVSNAQVERRKAAWDEIARLAGFEDERAVRHKGYVISLDLKSDTIIIKEKPGE